MICPVCKEQELKSRVTVQDVTAHAVHTPTQYDEEGHLVMGHESSLTTTYCCSNGHVFSVHDHGTKATILRGKPMEVKSYFVPSLGLPPIPMYTDAEMPLMYVGDAGDEDD